MGLLLFLLVISLKLTFKHCTYRTPQAEVPALYDTLDLIRPCWILLRTLQPSRQISVSLSPEEHREDGRDEIGKDVDRTERQTGSRGETRHLAKEIKKKLNRLYI